MNDSKDKGIWQTLQSRKLHECIVDFPAKNADGSPLFRVRIRTLMQDDLAEIERLSISEADKWFAQMKIQTDRDSRVYRERLYDISANHYLFRCCFHETEDERLFDAPPLVSKLCTQDEINVLIKDYRRLQDEKGPLISYLTTDQFDGWVERLADDAEGSSFLGRILPDAQNQLMRYMARRLWEVTRLATDRFSAGSPLEDLSNGTTEPDPAT